MLPRLPTPELAILGSREDARARLQAHIDCGHQLLAELSLEIDLFAQWEQHRNWCEFAESLLKVVLTNESLSRNFVQPNSGPWYATLSPADALQVVRNQLTVLVTQLAGIRGSLELIPELLPSRKVFVVHGHDEAARESVARFLEKLKLEPIILQERASQGLTVIEKVQTYSDVVFAVVLVTADDVGAAKADQDD